MDEVIPNLWIGNIASALDVDGLKEHKIHSIVSAMRGRVALHDVSHFVQIDYNLMSRLTRQTAWHRQAFRRHQINIDDTEEEDILAHFLPTIAFIQAELDKGRGVLVHCQAGISTLPMPSLS